ncbi:hypothetical protein F0562_030920 [Nyssa sinensis]|uniref:Uncharacterized protein n=1 Tax=Nyssa sinensis TaxID=561372 RepID=A0A5J5AUT2_9ASTE|nr:hypothetical protein F0562_030920 [Nyssa sinensis]
MDYLEDLKNYEKSGVTKGTGTDVKDGFDLGRMRQLMEFLGNPQSSSSLSSRCSCNIHRSIHFSSKVLSRNLSWKCTYQGIC